MSYAYYNSATAGDLNCQNDLIDVMAKLIAGKCHPRTYAEQPLDQSLVCSQFEN